MEGDQGDVFVLPWKRIARVGERQIDWQRPSMNGPSMGAVEGWVVTHDGETIQSGFKSDFEAMEWLHKRHGYSADHAVRHEGYDIVLVQDGQVVQSYRRDALGTGSLGAIELVELGAAKARRVKPSKIPLKMADRLARQVEGWLEPFVDHIELVGSVRRRSLTVGDIEFVVLPRDLDEFFGILAEEGFTGGERKQVAPIKGMPVELYIAYSPKELGGLVFMYTGDWQFNIAMRTKAKKRGLKLNQYGIWRGEKPVLQSEDERDFFKFLDVRYHTPEERSLASRGKPKKAGKGGRMGMFSEEAEAYLSRLESVWGEEG